MMKKLLLTALFSIVGSTAYSASFAEVPVTSFTDVATNGAMMFSSAPIRFIAVTISTPSDNGYIAFFRSTSPVFTANITTQTKINTNFAPGNSYPQTVPLYDMYNDSYTYFSKFGNAEVTLWFKCTGSTNLGVCPGLKRSGGRP